MDATILIERVDSLIDALPQVRQQLFTKIQQERSSAWHASALVQQAFDQWL
jgi:hypothetical protein